MDKLKLQTQTGFSIIELIVVISIIGIMSSLMFANYRQGERDTTLEYAAQQIAQDIRHAQNLSLAGAQIDSEKTYGYGIRFEENKSEYFIYGDIGSKNTAYKYNSDNDKIVSPNPITLSPNIKIDVITISPNDGDVVDIFFLPPDPVTYINYIDEVYMNTEAKIKVCFTITAKCKTITITISGRVEIE